jgi:hypothetical protein
MPWRMLLALLALAALVVGVGYTAPAPEPPRAADQLGPAAEEGAAEYQARARASLADAGTEQRWALLLLAEPATPAAAGEAAAGVRISQVVIARASEAGQWLDWVDMPSAAQDAQSARVVIESALRQSAGRAPSLAQGDEACACIKALLVRGDGAALRAAADRPGVFAVEALPADAVHGRIGLRLG